MVFLWFSYGFDGFPMVFLWFTDPPRQIGASGPWRAARLALGGPPRRPAASLPDLHGLAAELSREVFHAFGQISMPWMVGQGKSYIL